VVGQFLSADTVQGNAQGMDPYAYVGGNPETKTDPTGQKFTDGNGSFASTDRQGDLWVYQAVPWIYITPKFPDPYRVFHYTKAQLHSPVSKAPPSGCDRPNTCWEPSTSGSGGNSGVNSTGHPFNLSWWTNYSSISYFNYNYGIGIGPTSQNDQWNLGLSGDGSLFDANVGGVVGNDQWGVGYQFGVKGPEASIQAGCTTESGTCGLGFSVSPAATVYASGGFNVAGVPLRETVTVGPVIQLSASVSAQSISISVPFFSVSFSW
jgi:hypothetical protein